MTQRSLGSGAGIMAAKSCFRPEKWLKPVNRNMITKAMRPASLQEESRLTPSAPKPRRRMNETTRTKRDTMCFLSAEADSCPPLMSRSSMGRSYFCSASLRLPQIVVEGQRLGSCFPISSFHLPCYFRLEPNLHCGSQSAPRGGPRPSAILPQYSCNRIAGVKAGRPTIRTLCYDVSYLGKVRRFMTKGPERDVSRGRDAPFGTLLKRLREASGLTQEDLAGRAGLSAKGIS